MGILDNVLDAMKDAPIGLTDLPRNAGMPTRKADRRDIVGKFTSTSYGPPWNAMNGTGVTADGTDLRSSKQAYGIAVDPKEIPLGSMVYVWPNPFSYRGQFKAFDTGGAIKGKRIDFYDWRGRTRQLAWGRRTVTVAKGQSILENVTGTESAPKVKDVVLDPLDRLTDFLSKFDVLFDGGFWRRVGLILLGVAAAILGVALIGREYVTAPLKGLRR